MGDASARFDRAEATYMISNLRWPPIPVPAKNEWYRVCYGWGSEWHRWDGERIHVSKTTPPFVSRETARRCLSVALRAFNRRKP